MDMDFGPDGSLYLIEWGSGFGGNNADSGIYRIDYVAEGRRPIAHATATPDNGPTPLTVQFLSAGSVDPDGTALTYAWDFDGNGSTDSTAANPTHTYNTAGAFNATLRVTDQSGQTGVDQVRVVAGNTAPTVTIEFPEEGQFAAFGETDLQDRGHRPRGRDDRLRRRHAQRLARARPARTRAVREDRLRGHVPDGHRLRSRRRCEHVPGDRGGLHRQRRRGAPALTGRDLDVLQPKRKQAEFFTSTGRAPGVTGGGDPGVQTETTTDTQGGGLNIGFIENGDDVSYTR